MFLFCPPQLSLYAISRFEGTAFSFKNVSTQEPIYCDLFDPTLIPHVHVATTCSASVLHPSYMSKVDACSKLHWRWEERSAEITVNQMWLFQFQSHSEIVLSPPVTGGKYTQLFVGGVAVQNEAGDISGDVSASIRILYIGVTHLAGVTSWASGVEHKK